MDEKTDAGAAIPMMFGGIILFLVLFMLAIEFQNIYYINRTFSKELDRAATIAIVKAMNDDYRIDGESYINTIVAQDEFYDYTREVMDLNFSLEHYGDGKEYRLVIDRFDITENPPQLEVEGKVYLKPIFIQGLLDKYVGGITEIEIPVEAISKNQRLD